MIEQRSLQRERAGRQPAARQGQALVEFAIISFVLTGMLAGTLGLIVLGLGSFQNNIAAESIGRYLDERLPSSLSTAQDVYDELAEQDFYKEEHLIISPANWFDAGFRKNLPEVNRTLLPNYIYDPDLDVYRYPGAVVTNALDQQTVLIPLLPDASLGASRGIDRAFNVNLGDVPVSADWVGPVSISKIDDDDDTTYRVVVFYPSQPGPLLNLQVVRDIDGTILSQDPIEADDSAVSLSALPSGYTFATPTVSVPENASTSRGKYGLGETFAFLKRVRPYRRVFESASIVRLEDVEETEP